MAEELETAFRRARALLSSLNSLIICAQEVEENSGQLGSCTFLLAELGDAISGLEDRLRGWSATAPVAND